MRNWDFGGALWVIVAFLAAIALAIWIAKAI